MYFLSVNRIRRDTGEGPIGGAIRAHVEWVRRMISKGMIRQAGRWGDAGGILIIAAKDQAEAEAVQREDPLVTANLVTYEIATFHPDVEIS